MVLFLFKTRIDASERRETRRGTTKSRVQDVSAK